MSADQQSTIASQLPKQVDLAIIAAMPEELDPVLNLLGGREHWDTFTLDGYIHYSAQFGCGPRPLTVVAGSLWKYGGDATAVEVQRLQRLRPGLLMMTGICAGWHAKDMALGDVIVADSAFHAGEGKQTKDGFKADIRTFQPPPWLLGWLTDFSHNQQWFTTITTPRPPSLEYQAEWLLCQIATWGTATVPNAAAWAELKTHGIRYPQAKQRLQDKKLLSSTGKLTKQAEKRIETLRQQNYGQLVPTQDRAEPKVHYGAFASTEAVVAIEDPFKAPAEHVRKVLAIDLEVASLFAAAAEVGVPAFAVKAVSDYGTPDKDDAFHAYAAEAAVRWMHAFVCHNASLLNERRAKNPTVPADASPGVRPTATNVMRGGDMASLSVAREDIDTQQTLLNTHRRTLASYLLRLAQLGSAHAPPEIDHGIREARANIRDCKAILHGWGVPIEDHPNDIAP
jgi:nucleoside phosphorylase